MREKKYSLAICSLYANPITVGHTDYIKAASDLADEVCVIVNSDHQVSLKGSCPFMCEDDRLEIIQAIDCVDKAFIAVDKDGTVAKSIEVIAQLYPDTKIAFCNGGDRQIGNHSTLEGLTCDEYLIDAIYNVGGDYKRESSSSLIARGADWVYDRKAEFITPRNEEIEGATDEFTDEEIESLGINRGDMDNITPYRAMLAARKLNKLVKKNPPPEWYMTGEDSVFGPPSQDFDETLTYNENFPTNEELRSAMKNAYDRQQDLVLDLKELPDEKTTDMIYERIPHCLISQTNGVPQLTVSRPPVPDLTEIYVSREVMEDIREWQTDGNKDEHGMYSKKGVIHDKS